jgi:hypothetical protein
MTTAWKLGVVALAAGTAVAVVALLGVGLAELAAREREREPAPAPVTSSATAPAPRAAADAPSAPPRAEPLQVAFKLDPRLTRSLYMGERWVSPPTYATAQRGAVFVVEARARRADGRRSTAPPTWTASDPTMVAIATGARGEARLAVLRPGTSSVVVRDGDASRTLRVAANRQADDWRVDISQ